jgi:hypothetical protein
MIESVDITEIRRPTGWSPIRRELGVQAFGINAWHGDSGKVVVGEHDETQSGHEELYVVTAGAAAFSVDGDEVAATPGTVVFVRDPASKRSAVATEDGTTVVSVGGKPGEAYVPRVWEVSAETIALFEHERFDDAKALINSSMDEFDRHWVLSYNLACAEARTDDPEHAIEHLREAIEKRPQAKDAARDDSDFESLRGDPRFVELVG